MSVIYVNFKTRNVEYKSSEAIQVLSPVLDMFEQYDEAIEGIKNRFGENQPKSGVVYKQKFTTSKFDTYGHGCVHNSIHQYKPKKGEQWNRPMPMPADLRAVDSYLKARSGTTVVLGYKSDPFQWLDQKYKNTKHTLELANNYGVKLELHTMSDLCAHEDYIELIKAGGHMVKMNMGFEFESADEQRINSPGAPSVLRRSKAIDKLQSYGVTVELVYKKRPVKKSAASKQLFANLKYKNEGV